LGATIVLHEVFQLERRLQEKLLPTLEMALKGGGPASPWLIGLTATEDLGAHSVSPAFRQAISTLLVPIPPTPPTDFPALERQTIVEAFRRAKGNMSATARALKIPRSTLRGKLEKYGRE
jgi:DNA-binding NtrC family response regulator